MELGVGGEAEILLIDDDNLIYKYYSYNNNMTGYENKSKVADGLIKFKRSCFKHPDYINYPKYIKKGLIKIENSYNCWNVSDDGYDMMAIRFIGRLFQEYHFERSIPKKLAIHY
ncbi:hypothetical protein D081_0329 [Anaerovibrio sp. JC8]|uniref:hypothetical protein n=1 Tax=Anaerovibrio sp. JC8 TaxID=1240085 RepID=UPI000A0DE1B7|nr:hypothetical protein [Anaerovibrio sp. JC8]ORU01510.1 hypothetical protein D081_0329 [Anaerovibrio sp. JC8]